MGHFLAFLFWLLVSVAAAGSAGLILEFWPSPWALQAVAIVAFALCVGTAVFSFLVATVGVASVVNEDKRP